MLADVEFPVEVELVWVLLAEVVNVEFVKAVELPPLELVWAVMLLVVKPVELPVSELNVELAIALEPKLGPVRLPMVDSVVAVELPVMGDSGIGTAELTVVVDSGIGAVVAGAVVVVLAVEFSGVKVGISKLPEKI